MVHDEIPQDATGDAIRRVRDSGSDLSKPMVIDFHIAVPSEVSGGRIAIGAQKGGYKTEVYCDDTGKNWTCQCSKTMIASHSAITQIEQELGTLSKSEGGYMDGWGTFGNGDG